MPQLVTEVRIAAWQVEYLMGTLWDAAARPQQIAAVDTAEGIWRTFRWRAGTNPFVSRQIATELEWPLAAHARHVLEAEGLPDVSLPRIVENLIGDRVGARVTALVSTDAGAEGVLTEAKASAEYLRLSDLQRVMAENFQAAGDLAFGGNATWRTGGVSVRSSGPEAQPASASGFPASGAPQARRVYGLRYAVPSANVMPGTTAVRQSIAAFLFVHYRAPLRGAPGGTVVIPTFHLQYTAPDRSTLPDIVEGSVLTNRGTFGTSGRTYTFPFLLQVGGQGWVVLLNRNDWFEVGAAWDTGDRLFFSVDALIVR